MAGLLNTLNSLDNNNNNSNETITPLTRAQALGATEFIALIHTISTVHCILTSNKWPRSCTLNDNPHYDFIVVGAGSSGIPLAVGLSENKRHNVLLIERGDDPRFECDFPALFFLLQKTSIDWQYWAESCSACQGMEGGCFWPRGKVLGGSSTINGMLYHRGIPHDYDSWARQGNKGWDFESCLPYFKITEGNLNPKFIGKYHNATGPMKIDVFGELDEVKKVFVAAAKEHGHKFYDDMNADKVLGYWNSQAFYAHNRRQSTAWAFIDELKNRPNLHVLKGTLARKVLINKRNEAYGVEIEYPTKNGFRRMNVFAKKEVIVSGGAINSPQLLMLSGIGPRAHLTKMNITICKDLPMVGQKLFDHLYNPLWFEFDPIPSLMGTVETVLNSGILSHPFQIMGFVCTEKDLNLPNVEILVLSVPPNSPDLSIFMKTLNYKLEIQQKLLEANILHCVGVVATVLLKPESCGSIELKETDPLVHPRIFANYLSHPKDVKTLVQAAIQQVSLTNTKAYKSIGLKFLQLPIPECSKYEFNSEVYWRIYCKYMTTTLYHPIGTCRMGTNETGVVDHELKVHGVAKLRVVDASVMPSTISGHTNAAAIMIGEKAGDMMKKFYSCHN